MKAITVRNLPPAVARAIGERASKEGISTNRAVVSLLEEATGRRRPRAAAAPLHHDLDALAGIWSREESVEFERALREQRTIDPELWK
jgi:plasmid stability protein